MILSSSSCCSDCAQGAGMGAWYDYVNPIKSISKVGGAVVDALGEVAGKVADNVDSFAKKTLSTTLTSGAAARSLLKPQGEGGAADPQVSYTPLAVGGLAAAGLLLWALTSKKKVHP